MQDWSCSLALFVTLLTSIKILGVEVSSRTKETENATCIQNCSWRSYDRDTSEWVENRCEMTNPGNNIVGCPNIYPLSDSASSLPSQVKQFDVSYYTTIGGSDTSRSVLCANVTFKVERPAVDLVKGIRLTLIGKTYNDLNIYCVVWDIKTKLSFCSVSSSNCSINDDVRTFYFDCFCGLTPGSGLQNTHEGYLVSVDTLPKLEEQHQEFRLFPVPGCQDFPTNEHCQLTPKEKWRPLFSSLQQQCNFSSINITFDLPPEDYDVKKIGVFLYNNATGKRVWAQPFLMVSQLRRHERTLFNTTYNITSLICYENLDRNFSYIIGTKIQDRDPGKRYLTKRIYSTSVFLRNPPCSSNPCSTREVCIADCWSYTCECDIDTLRIHGECQVPWYPKDLKIISHKSTHEVLFAESPPHYSRVENYRIGLFTNGSVEYVHAQTTMNHDGTIYASFNNLEGNKTYTPAVRITDECPRCQYKFYNSSQFEVDIEGIRIYTIIAYIVSAVLPILLLACLIRHHGMHKTSKGSSNTRQFPEGVRLVCSQNPHLQNFTNKLCQVLQDNVQLGCLVSVETLNDTTQEGIAHWLVEAKRKGDRVCFILDHNLSILDFEESQDYKMSFKVHSLVDSVLLDEMKSPVLLKFDFIPTESTPDGEQRFVISLPSGLKDLVKELNAGADLSSLGFDGVLDAYVKIKNILEQKMCHSSVEEWRKRARNMDEEESLASGFICQSVLTLDEEDATYELIEASIYNPPEHMTNDDSY